MDNKIKYLALISVITISMIMISVLMIPSSNAQTTYYTNQTISPKIIKPFYYPSVSGTINGRTYQIQAVQPAHIIPVPQNMFNGWATYSRAFDNTLKANSGALVLQYPCLAPDLTGQNQGFTDDSSQAGFVNRTYLYPDQDYSTHCDITTTQEKSFQANNVLLFDKDIQKMSSKVFRTSYNGTTSAQELLHQKLMFATNLIYQNKYDMALTQLADIKADINGGHQGVPAYVIDQDTQNLLLPRLDNLMLQTVLVSTPGAQLPSVTTSSVPEYGPIAVLVLAIAIISIILVSTKNNLRFTP